MGRDVEERTVGKTGDQGYDTHGVEKRWQDFWDKERIYRFDPLTRLFLAWCYNLLARTIFRLRVRDIDCAFKLFRREVFDVIEIRSKKFFVDTEILAKARYHGFRITEIGVRHYPRVGGSSTVRPSHVLSTLKELTKIWF